MVNLVVLNHVYNVVLALFVRLLPMHKQTSLATAFLPNDDQGKALLELILEGVPLGV